MQGVIEGVPVILVLIAGIAAPLAGWYATRRYRSPGTWFVLGALTGPIALGLLAVSPPGRCPECDARIDGWAAYCDRCDEPLPARITLGASAPAQSSSARVPVMARLVHAAVLRECAWRFRDLNWHPPSVVRAIEPMGAGTSQLRSSRPSAVARNTRASLLSIQ